VVGYRIYYWAEGSQDTHTNPSSVDVGASTTQHTLSGLQGGICYTITMVTKSQYYLSIVAGPVRVTLSMFTNYIVITELVNSIRIGIAWTSNSYMKNFRNSKLIIFYNNLLFLFKCFHDKLHVQCHEKAL